MSVEIDMSGLDRQFLELGSRTVRGGKKASKTGADIVAEKLKEKTPYEDVSDRKWRAQRVMEQITGSSHEFKHMRDDIEVSKDNDLGDYIVHYGQDTAWRSRFVNDGTIHQKPQHFVEKTIEETKEAVRVTMQEIINAELNGL